MRKIAILLVLFGLTTALPIIFKGEKSPLPPEVPVKDMVTMLDIGSGNCVPCKMMVPIMKELENEYSGKAAILLSI